MDCCFYTPRHINGTQQSDAEDDEDDEDEIEDEIEESIEAAVFENKQVLSK